MTREEMDFIGSMNMCDEISNEAYQKIMAHCEEQEPCEDCISREAVIDLVADYDLHMGQVVKGIHALPPVKPQPKVGKWLKSSIGGAEVCSICQAHMGLSNFRYCPHCGAKMEVEE